MNHCSSPTHKAQLFTGQFEGPDQSDPIQPAGASALCLLVLLQTCGFAYSQVSLCASFFPPSWDNLLTLKYLFVSLPSVFSHSLSFCLLCLIWWEDKLPTFHVCLFVVSLCACRSPTSPGRGGLLFSRCLRTLSGRPGVCLPKRYHNPAVPCVWLGLNLVSDVTAFLAMVSSPF